MAVNQVTLALYPPRWRQRVTPLPNSFTDEGKPVQLVDAVPAESAEAPVITVKSLGEWLTEQGFVQGSQGDFCTFERGQIQSIFGLEKEIDVGISGKDGEVALVSCRFALPCGNRPPITEWAKLVDAMCGRFGLRLGESENAQCNTAEFTAAVLENRFYLEMAAAFGWELPYH